MKTKQELRQSLEGKARQFWYDFNYQLEGEIRKSYHEYEQTLKPKQVEYMKEHGNTLENAINGSLLTEEEINSCLGRASLTALLVMNPTNKGKTKPYEKSPTGEIVVIPDYQTTLNIVQDFYKDYGCKRCLTHYFDKGIFNESNMSRFASFSKVIKTHPEHKINELRRGIDSYRLIGGGLEFHPGNMPEVKRIRKEIAKLQRKNDKLEIEEGINPIEHVAGSYPINEQIIADIDLEMSQKAS